MSNKKRRGVTLGLFILAAGVVVTALALGGGDNRAKAAKHQPDGDNIQPPVHNFTTTTPPVVKRPPPVPTEPPKVDIVFVLDTTGSMSGLLAGAKRKIWSIANKVLSGQPRPHVRFGLIGYRDIGDAYVTKRYELTEDLDDIHEHLKGLRAAGGGDTPEHVNQALAEAIRQMQWRHGDGVLRQIYLVGDAPPHEGRSGLRSADLAREATNRQIVINAVRCGSMPRTQLAWQRIARLAGGLYASIRQDGNMYAVKTPMDRRLADLNARLSATLLASGGAAAKRATRRRATANAAMDRVAQAESAAYRARSGRIDSNDLLTRIKRGKKLSSFKPSDLPAPVAAMPKTEREAYVAKVARQRATLRNKIVKLATKRKAYIKNQRRAMKRGDGFDDKIGAALRSQGAKAGIAY